MADKRIKDLTNTATESDIASGNYFALDGSAGTKKLNSTTLLTKTAQNALADNVVPAFNSSKSYLRDDFVEYNGKLYQFTAAHSGVWTGSDVLTINEAWKSVKDLAVGDKTNATATTNQYINNDGSLTDSVSWTAYKFVGDSFKFVYARLVSSLNNPLIAFYSSDTPSSSSCIGTIPASSTGTSFLNYYTAVPSGTKCVVVCSRSSTSPDEEVYISANIGSVIEEVKTMIAGEVEVSENRFISATKDDAFSVDNYYFGGASFTYSVSWIRYIFENKGYKKVKAKAATNTATFGMIVFLDSAMDVLSYVQYGSTSGAVTKTENIPSGCAFIAVCNRTASFASPEMYLYSENLVKVFDEIEGIKDGVCGVMKLKTAKGRPPYSVAIGNFGDFAAHFKMAMVKDGVRKYNLDQTNILKDENNLFDSVLDGTDGDMLIVNDAPFYMVCGSTEVYDYRLFSFAPFVFDGVVADKIECRGEAPSLCFVDNINDANYNDHEANLGSGKTHYVRNDANVAYHSGMTDLVGKYVPSEVGGVISYSYDSSKSFLDGSFLPSVHLNQNTAERAAMNKDVDGAQYTNLDLLSLDIVIALAETECGTNEINSASLFGNGFSGSVDISPAAINESVFTNGTYAVNGARYKNSSDAWVYARLNAKPFNNDKYLFEMLTDWMTPWEIMEQHLALSYAKANSIAANTWFVYNGNEYKYTNVGTLKGLADGVMTANLFKKFRTKLGNVTLSGVSVQGNDIEFVILSSVYRGWILDVCPHRWITGLNVVVDDANKYSFFATKNPAKYLMNKNYTEIAGTETYDFEKSYDFVSAITESGANFIYPKTSSKKSVYAYVEKGAAINTFECGLSETDKKKADSGKKVVTGVKLGYGTFSDKCSRNFLYLYHPRTYVVAKAGYSSFVCQNVKV